MKTNSLKLLTLVFLSLTTMFTNVYSQQTMGMTNFGTPVLRVPDSYGVPIAKGSYTDLKGNPYFKDDWTTGSVELANGELYNNLTLRYNQIDGLLSFQRGGAELRFPKPIRKFVLGDTLTGNKFQNGFPPIDANTADTFYEILVDGSLKLLKAESKKIAEFKGYDQITERKIVKNTEYYVFNDGKLVGIKPNKSSVEKLVTDNHIKLKNNVKISSIRNEEDLVAFFKNNLN